MGPLNVVVKMRLFAVTRLVRSACILARDISGSRYIYSSDVESLRCYDLAVSFETHGMIFSKLFEYTRQKEALRGYIVYSLYLP